MDRQKNSNEPPGLPPTSASSSRDCVGYAVHLPGNDASALGPLRTALGLEVCEEEDAIWLRATLPGEPLVQALRSLPGGEMFAVLADAQLCRAGSSVPKGFLPEGPWLRLSSWLRVELPVAALPGQQHDRCALHLAPSRVLREPNMLLTSLARWIAYGSQAPQVRLERWHFAVRAARPVPCGDNQNREEVLVRGRPLPPLPGTRLVEEQGIAVPCGRAWSPAIGADVLARHFELSSNDVLLWREEGRRERIASEQFVRATRSAIRASAGRARDDG